MRKNKLDFMIDPEFQSQIPALTDDEFRQLEENILSAGEVISPLIIWGKTLVDGHNRYEILQRHPEISYSVRSIDCYCETREDVLAWICKHQLGRRNLTPEQKKFLIGKQYSMEKSTHGGKRGNQYTQVATCQLDNLPHSESTLERIARESNVSPSYVARAEHFMKTVELMEKYHPGIREDVLSGKRKLSQREIAIISGTSKDALPFVIESWLDGKLNSEKDCDSGVYEDVKLVSKLNEARDTIVSKPEDCSKLPQRVSASSASVRKSTDLQTIRDLSDKMESVDHVADAEGMLSEIKGASMDFMHRIDYCTELYPGLLTDVELEFNVINILQEVADYIDQMKEQYFQHTRTEQIDSFEG